MQSEVDKLQARIRALQENAAMTQILQEENEALKARVGILETHVRRNHERANASYEKLFLQKQLQPRMMPTSSMSPGRQRSSRKNGLAKPRINGLAKPQYRTSAAPPPPHLKDIAVARPPPPKKAKRTKARVKKLRKKLKFSVGDVDMWGMYVGAYRGVDVPHGKGRVTFSRSESGLPTEYDGYFKEGKLTGKGEFEFENGDHYKGGVVNGRFHGKGKYTWKYGTIWNGMYEEDWMCGRGVMTWIDGTRFEGVMHEKRNGDEEMYGVGKLTWIVKGGKNVCDGSVKWPPTRDPHLFTSMKEVAITYWNGDAYFGHVLDGKRSGVGEYRWSGGRWFGGQGFLFVKGQARGDWVKGTFSVDEIEDEDAEYYVKATGKSERRCYVYSKRMQRKGQVIQKFESFQVTPSGSLSSDRGKIDIAIPVKGAKSNVDLSSVMTTDELQMTGRKRKSAAEILAEEPPMKRQKVDHVPPRGGKKDKTIVIIE